MGCCDQRCPCCFPTAFSWCAVTRSLRLQKADLSAPISLAGDGQHPLDLGRVLCGYSPNEVYFICGNLLVPKSVVRSRQAPTAGKPPAALRAGEEYIPPSWS